MLNEETSFFKLSKRIESFKNNWSKYAIYVLSTSIILMFTFSLKYKQNLELQTINNWVGIILGLLATMTSVISLFLSFYNLEKEGEESKDNQRTLGEMKDLLYQVKSSQADFAKSMLDQANDTKAIKDCVLKKDTPQKIPDRKGPATSSIDYFSVLSNSKFIDKDTINKYIKNRDILSKYNIDQEDEKE